MTRCQVTSSDGRRCWLVSHETAVHVYIDRGWHQTFTVCSETFTNHALTDPHINDQQPESLRRA